MELYRGSNYDYHLIINQLAEVFEGHFESLSGNTEKFIAFSVTRQKENVNGKTVTCKIKFINIVRFMTISLSILANNLTVELEKG